MHGHAFATRDVADNLLAANRIATSRAVDQQLVLSFYLKRIRTARHRDALNRVRYSSDGCIGFRSLLAGDTWCQAIEYLPCRILSKADSREQIVRRSHAVFSGDALVVGFIKFRQRYFVLARFTFQQLATNFNGTFPLMLVQPVLDLIARARAFNEGEPIPARWVAVLCDNFEHVTITQLGTQGDHAPVHLRANTRVAYLRVNGIGKVQRTGVFR